MHRIFYLYTKSFSDTKRNAPSFFVLLLWHAEKTFSFRCNGAHFQGILCFDQEPAYHQ